MALPAGFVLDKPEKVKLPAGFVLDSQKEEAGLPSIVKSEPREAPAYDVLGQVIGDVAPPMDYTVEGQGKMNEPGAFTTIADLAKQFIAPGAKAPFALPLATETAAKGLVRQTLEQPESGLTSAVQPGIVRLLSPLLMQQRDAMFGPRTEEDRLKKQLEIQRTIASIPSIPGAKELNKIGENVQKDIQNSLSPEAKKALEESQITGNIFKGEVDFGTNPNAYGYALQAANVFGSMAPVIATAMVTKSPGAGGYVGGTMAADEAATKAAEFINKIPDAELRQKSPIYAELIAAGASPKEARELTIKKAAESGAILQGLVATFGDVLTGKLVTGAFDKAIAKLGTNRLARGVGVGTASGLEESLQETGEGLASDVTLKNVIPSKEIGEDSAANLILGFLGGAGPGVAKGALSQGEQAEKAPEREKYVKPEGGLAELIARQKGFLTPQGTTAVPPAAPPAAPTGIAPAAPVVPAAPASEALDTQAMLEELINSVNSSIAPNLQKPEAKKPVETPKLEAAEEQAPPTIKIYRGHRIGEEFKSADDGNLGAGFYTTESEQAAKEFASRNKNGTVLQGELKASRILDLDKLSKQDLANLKRAIPKTAEELQAYGIPYYDEATNEAITEDLQKIHSNLNRGGFEPRKLSDALPQGYTEALGAIYNEAGYDALTRMGDALKSGTKYKEYVTFSPESQKLLTPKVDEELAPDEAFGITGGKAPQPQEFLEAKQAVDEVTKQVIKMRAKPAGSLWSKLIGALNPEEVREIFGNNPNLGQRKLQVVQGNGRGSYIVDLVDNGTLDAFLPPDKRHDANNFDAAESAQLIKDAIAEKDYLPFDAKIEIEMMFDSVKFAEDLVKEYLTQEEQNRELQIAADEQREADQNVEIPQPSDKNRPAGAGEREALELAGETPEEVRAKLAEQERRTKEEERAKKAAEEKARADQQAAEFTLTGSDREADVAAARGQKDIFAAPPPESPKPQTEQERTVSMTKKEFREDKETRGKSDHPALKMVFEGMTPKGLIDKYGEKDVRFLGRLFDIDVKDKLNVAKKLIALDKGLSLIRGKTKADYDKMNKEMLGGYLEAVGQSKFGRKYEMVDRLLRYETNVMGKFYDNLQDLKHKAAILNEARAGKPISEEVLKDYPDVAAYTLPRGSDGYKAAIRTLAVKSLPTLGMDTPATIAAYREDAKTTKDPLEKYVAADIADYMEQYYKGQQQKRDTLNAKIEAAQEPTMTSMAAESRLIKEKLAAIDKDLTKSKSLKAMRGEKFVPDALDKKAIAIYKQIKENNPEAEVDEYIENPNTAHDIEEKPNAKDIRIGDLVYEKGDPVPKIAITVDKDSVKLIDQKTGVGVFSKIESVSKEPIPHDYSFDFGYGKIDVDVETFTSPTEWSVSMSGPGAGKTGYRSALGVKFEGKRGTPAFDEFVEKVVRNNTKEAAEAAPKDNKQEIADLKKEQKTLMREIIKAGLEETPEQEARMAEIDKRLRELEGKPAIQKEEKPAAKQRSVEEIQAELQDLEDQLDLELNKEKRTALVSQIFKLQGELTTAEGRAARAAAEEPAEQTEAEKEAAAEANEEALRSKAEAEIDAGPIGQAITKIENGDIETKAQIRSFIKKLERDGTLDDVEDVREGLGDREQDASEVLDTLSGLLDEARDNAIEERFDELLEESETEQPEAPKGTVATPDGAVLRYPLAVSLVDDGYKVLALDDPRTYRDKGGDPHRTFEKGPLRIAMTPQRVLFQNRNSVNVAFGNPDQVTLEAIMVDPGKRNQGLATQAMNDVIEAADKNEITLYLEPVPIVNIKKNDFGLDRDQLVDFYSKFGFEFQEDSNKVMQRKPSAEVEVLPAEEPQAVGLIENEPYTFEGQFTEIGDEEQRTLITDQSSKLSAAQINTLEQEYGAKNGSDEFFEALRKDVIAYVTEGAKAVSGKIRAIIRQMANGLLSVAIVFNPQFVSKPYTIAVPQYDIRTSEVVKDLPKEAKSMSDAAKRAYGVIYPTLEAELKEKDKLFIIADKQSGNTYMFQPDGSLLKQSKTLFGAGIGDFMKGDNEIVANRITPAGLFDLGLRDAKRSEGEARTAGEYDFGKVFVLDNAYMGRNGPFSQTIMHSVWTHEKDAKQRLAALDKPGAEDSRYSFGCINLNKEEFRYMITNHLSQMDGAKIFIVPENGTNVMDFVNGKAVYSDDIIRKPTKPLTKTVKVEKQRAAPKVEERTMVGKEEEPGIFMSLEPQTQTQAFKKWFGDSKVVDADGKPLVVYHGTIVRPDTATVKGMGDIMAFDRMFTTQFRAPSIDTVGSFFSTNPGEGGAQMYSGTGEGAAIYPVYLSIKNPYTTTFETMLRRARMMENGVDDGRKIGAKEVEALRRFLKETGRDGIHIKADPKGGEFGNQDVWIALEPEQIKSATGNRGTFNESGNINMSLGDALVDMVNSMADNMDQDEKKRAPSVKRQIKTYNRQRKNGKMSDEMFVMMTDAAIREDEENQLKKEPKDRERGYLHIQEKMSAAVRRGEMTREAYDLANWFMLQNEDLVADLGISIVGKGPSGSGGFYNNLSRVFTLIKEGGSDFTATHEILHHLERMMPTKIRQAIRKAWLTQLTKAAKATKDPVQKLYYEAVIDANLGDNKHTMLNIPEGAGKAYANARMALEDMYKGGTSAKLAETLLLQGAVPMDLYQFFNPSEFWAVNGTRIVEGRYEAVKGGNLGKLKNWLGELGQKIKSIFGLKSDASIIRALDSLSKSDGKFVTDEMLGQGDYQIIERRNYQGGEAPQPDMEIPEMSVMDNLIQKFGDKHIDTKRLIQSIESTGRKIHEQFDAYMKEENYHGRLAKRTEDFLDDEMRPLLQDMQDQGVTLDELEKFLLNRHAKEANAYIAKINPTGFPDAGSSVTDEAADKYMASLSKEEMAKYTALANRVDKIIKETQRVLVANGIETQETIDEWNKTYKFYVPLMRDQLDFVHTGRGVMGGFATRGPSTKRRVGSDKPVIDILANIAMMRERALRRSEQARVGRALYGMAIKHPNPGFWLAINPDAIKDKDKLEAELISLGLKPEDAESIIQEPRQPVFDRKTGLVKYQVNPLLRNSPNVFPVRVNGEDRFIFFNPNDPRALRMVESMRNMDTETLGDAIGAVGAVTRWIASVNTQYNIVFGGVNFLRDLGAANLNLSTTEIAGKEKEVRGHVLPALRAIYRDLRGKGATTPEMKEMQDWFERYQLAGGQTGYQNQFAESARKANIVERELKQLNRGNVKKAVDSVFDWLSDYNDAIENAVRLAAFRVAVEEGKLSEDKAASIAKNLTVNFNRKGAKSGIISALYAFFNAAVQGSARLIETLRGPMGKKIILGGMFLGSMQAIALAMAGFDDDEPPEFVKDKNFIVPIPFTDKKYLSIPYPLGFNMFPGFGRLATEAMLINAGMIKSRKGIGDKMASAASLVLDAFNPLGGAGNPLLMVAPTILDPFAAIYSNRDAFGRPIYREDKSTAPTPGYERSRENASLFSKKLAEALNWATSPRGTQHTKGWLSPTADQIDYFVGQITGGVGREIMKVGEFVKSKATTQEEVPAYKLPVVGRFYGEAESPAATRARFYENVTEMAKHEHEIKGLRKDKVSPAEYIKANPEARLWQRANNVENQVSKLNKEKRALIEKDAPREVIKRKEDEILKKMQQFNDQVRRGQ